MPRRRAPCPRSRRCSSRRRIARGDDFDLIDVREPHEWEIARIPGARSFRSARIIEALPTLDSARDIVVHCKMGGRSAKAVQQLQASGFRKVWNLAGGITRWSDDVTRPFRNTDRA